MSVLVFADSNNGAIAKSAVEAIHYGSKIGETTVITYGNVDDSALASLGNYGASKVLINKSINEFDGQKLSKLIRAAAESAEVIVFAMDFSGKSLASRVAAGLNAGLVSGALGLPDTSNGFVVRKAVFSGKAFANCKINSDKKVIALMPNSIQVETNDASASVEEFNADLGSSAVTVKEFKAKGGGGVLLTEADVIVSAGRGLKGPENWGMIEELATEMGAATACSRPVADIGWRPHHEHVGQTGIAVRPNLYIAVGISGAIQHLAGVNGSKVMVVINTDAEAPFFKAADYGVVGDAFDVVPKFIEKLKAFKAQQ
ncbi:MAG: electron transfer flavoprotein subunit alpha/FixB family protein [Flavobacteriales bacterium]|nr:electron transfer flavoprotein subunit alpha/FixB family protein [Flavobacteriales bacterium]